MRNAAGLRKALIQACVGLAALVVLISIVRSEDAPRKAEPVQGPAGNDEVAVAPPPFSEEIFPCSGCHEDLKVNTTPRQLKKNHKEIILHHGDRWCLDCHDALARDKLHLANGKLIDFTESFRLCGQCHGPTLRDWRAGEHGKRTGNWSGRKQYLLCVHCHNPHAPRYKPMEPLPPPVRPEDIR